MATGIGMGCSSGTGSGNDGGTSSSTTDGTTTGVADAGGTDTGGTDTTTGGTDTGATEGGTDTTTGGTDTTTGGTDTGTTEGGTDTGTTEGQCEPECDGKQCGPDNCGGECGACDAGQECDDDSGQCSEVCAVDCTDKVCGDNGCGGTCGECGQDQACDGGQCIDVCTPECTDKDCGDDGCEGSCGDCADGQKCGAVGQCVDDSSTDGDTCASAYPVGAVPYEHTGDTSLLSDDYDTDTCGDFADPKGDGDPDAVYAFAPDTDGIYTVTISPAPTTPHPALVYVTTDCADIGAGCIEASGDLFMGGDFVVALAAGTTYYFIVDAWLGGDAGPYVFEISEPCISSCDDKQCGDDGCGFFCGECSASEACDEQQQCQDASEVLGNTCANPFVIDAIPFSGSGDTEFVTDQLAYPDNACEGEDSDAGSASNDHAYSLTPENDGVYTILLDPDFDAALYVVTDCADILTTCLAASEGFGSEEVVVSLTAGTEYFIIVDGWSDSTNVFGTYTLTIDEPCLPSCDGKECGDNGCGGICAECTDGLVCDISGICVDPESLGGNTCDDALFADWVPLSFSGDTTSTTGDFTLPADSCVGATSEKGSASNDMVLEFLAPDAGGYTITLDADFDSALYVSLDCADIAGTCLAGSEGFGVEDLNISLEQGQSVFIFIDGWSNGSNVNGTYTLDITTCPQQCDGKTCGDDGCGGNCGLCADEDYCADGTCESKPVCEPLVDVGLACNMSVEGLSNGMEGSTNVFTTYPCSSDTFGESPEIALDLLVDQDAIVTVSEVDGGSIEVIVLQDEGFGCQWTDTGCVAFGFSSATFEASPSEQYYVLLDSWTKTTETNFGVEVSCCFPTCVDKECGDDGCGGSCGDCGDLFCDLSHVCLPLDDLVANTCDDPAIVDEIPYSASGTTDVATANYSFGDDACEGSSSGKGEASADHVFEFTPSETALYKIVIKDPDFDAALYIATDCADIDATCLAGKDGGGSEEINVQLEASTTYFVFVDGYSNFSNLSGQYTLTIDVCIPGCGALECGDDGCGGDCGECGDGNFCSDGVCANGNSCEDRCGDFTSGAGCQCDSLCFTLDDCCEDICDFCSADYPDGCQ